MSEPERRSKAVRLQHEWGKVGKQLSALGTAQLGANLRVELTKNPKPQIWEADLLVTVAFKKKRKVVKDWPYSVGSLIAVVNEVLSTQKATWLFAWETRDRDAWAWMCTSSKGDDKKNAGKKVVEHVSDVVGERHIAIFDSECVDGAADYATLVSILSSTTETILEGLKVECAEVDGHRRLVLRLGDHTVKATLAGGTDRADLPPLLEAMNLVVERLGESRRLYEVRQAEWRQEAGVAFATPKEASTLKRWGLLQEHGPSDEEA